MGELNDKAKSQSKFLIIDKGGSVLVKYVNFRFIPSNLDPSVEIVQYIVNQDGKEKYWNNGSASVMRQMDKIKKGSWIIINRDIWINKDGSEDRSKSTYSVQECNDEGRPIKLADTAEAV